LADGEAARLGLAPAESSAALLRGDIDIVFMLASWRSAAVRKLLHADGVVLEGYPRADAYIALFPSLSKVVLPMGVVDLERNIPSADATLLAVDASLVVRRDLHPALQYLLLDAAAEIHGGPEGFSRAGRYPAPEAIDFPLSDQARTYYRSGRPFVYRYLPVWMAGLVERLFILMIPLFAVVFPLAHFLPVIHAYITEHRIFSLYRELEVVERALELPGSLGSAGELADTLADLERRANHLRVPLSYAQRRFILKSHIALAQERVEKRRSPATVGTAGSG
jgi:hypothetical protein